MVSCKSVSDQNLVCLSCSLSFLPSSADRHDSLAKNSKWLSYLLAQNLEKSTIK